MVKVIGPLASHHASGRMSAPRVYSSSLRNRKDREAPPAPPPPSGGSLLFGSTTEHCNASTINHAQQYPGTVETWFRPVSFAGLIAGTIFTPIWTGASLYINATLLYAYVDIAPRGFWRSPVHSLSLNTWAHVAVTWDDTKMTVWENGIELDIHYGWAGTATQHTGFHIGGRIDPTEPYLDAYITRTRFSDVIRYTANFTPATDFTPDGNTIGLWRMTEGSGTTVADESGNGHTLEFPAANKPTWSDLVP